MTQQFDFSALGLGKQVAYCDHYDPSLLQAVPRQLARQQIGLSATLPFDGVDIWNGYELSWLNQKGKPQIAILECRVPIHSPNLIESKSFKLYLNSFNQTPFESIDALQHSLVTDLSACAGAEVTVKILRYSSFQQLQLHEAPDNSVCIDDLDITIDNTLSIMQAAQRLADSIQQDHNVDELLVSHLLKSNCLVTGQPDWASVLIRYQGPQICHEHLLQLICSFRQHNEFHEQCVERLFTLLMNYGQANKLSVYARYTRRGGLDINPFRSNFETPYPNHRMARQ